MKLTVQELVDMLRDAASPWRAYHIDAMDSRESRIDGAFNLDDVVRKINERRNDDS